MVSHLFDWSALVPNRDGNLLSEQVAEDSNFVVLLIMP